MKKIVFMAPSATSFSATKRSYDFYFKDNLSAANIDALDELFLASRSDDWWSSSLVFGHGAIGPCITLG
jgi:hypothetical protein